MRQITRKAIHAFNAGRAFASGNTTVVAPVTSDITLLVLHGNPIAKRHADGRLWVRTAGWDSVTTKERLNGLDGVDVCHKRHVLHLNGRPWSAHENWVQVTP